MASVEHIASNQEYEASKDRIQQAPLAGQMMGQFRSTKTAGNAS